jgi:hypothetical protein
MPEPTETPLFHVNILKKYINALIVNVKPPASPQDLNLIFDSGAVNGIMGIGAALYIHHLEKANFIKINKIAGCSIGSLIAVWYICDCPDNLYLFIDTLFADYKKNKNFFVYEQVVRHSVSQLFPDDAGIARLNGILYINYYDTKKCKQRVISKFKHREHLIRCILRSSHVPFLTSASHKYQGRYVDGISPHIFNESKHKHTQGKHTQGKHRQIKNLFIQLIHFTDITKTLNIKREKNIYSRLIRGVVETNEFFINGSSPICSYVGIKIKIHLFIREYVVFFILSLMDCIICLKSHIPPPFRDTFLYNKVCVMCKQLWEYFLDNLT